MSKTNHRSNSGHATLQDRTLDDAELNAVTGGSLNFTRVQYTMSGMDPAGGPAPAKHWFNGG